MILRRATSKPEDCTGCSPPGSIARLRPHPSVAARSRPKDPKSRMLTLFHHSFCPHSRFVRLALGEYGIDVRLIEERTWDRRDDFLAMNPAGTTPVLVQEACPPIPGAAIIAEYLDEIGGAELAERRLLPANSS